MSARQDTDALRRTLTANGIEATYEDANTLRRAQLTLHRWAELECGDSDQWKSWAIERDEDTGIPYMAVYPHAGRAERGAYRIPDRETGALRRVATLCERLGAHFYHQGDPRGCALYVSREPMPPNDYTRGVACC